MRKYRYPSGEMDGQSWMSDVAGKEGKVDSKMDVRT